LCQSRADTNAYPYTNGRPDLDPCADVDSNANGNTETNANGNSEAWRDAGADSDAYTHA
jgi:hypothetical protein